MWQHGATSERGEHQFVNPSMPLAKIILVERCVRDAAPRIPAVLSILVHNAEANVGGVPTTMVVVGAALNA